MSEIVVAEIIEEVERVEVVVQEASDGAPGTAGTITIGTVTTGAPGSEVIITNVGTASAAILNITIPRGNAGSEANVTNTNVNVAIASNPNATLDALGYDLLALDLGRISLRDDFMGGTDSATVVGQLNWQVSYVNGAGSTRPQQNDGFGVLGLNTAAARRAYAVAIQDVSNLIGGGGFFLSALRTSSFKLRTRVRISTLDCRFDVGFRSFAVTSSRGTRNLSIIYCKASAAWTASTVMTAGDFRRPVSANGRRYYASAGTTSGTEPTWPTAYGATVVDGSVTWTCDGRDGNGQLQISSAAGDEALGNIASTGVTVAANTWYVIDVGWSGTEWTCTVNGSSPVSVAAAADVGNVLLPYFDIETTTATSAVLSMDFWGMVVNLTRP